MRQLSTITILLFLLIAPLPILAQNKKLISSRCRSNGCWETYFLGKKVFYQDQLDGKVRAVYQVNVELRNPHGTSQESRWVQCSTKQPFVASTSPDWNPDTVSISYINPGARLSNAEIPSHLLYWAICHNQWQVDLENVAGKAKTLGYSLQLRTEQREVPKAQFNP